jgi:adenine-specific DNA-methyltransferase
MSQKYDKLKALLKELFQLDQPDLDFGLYRIMHAKSAEVTQFLEVDLLPQVKQAFSLYKTSDKSELEKELAKAIEQAEGLGVDPESSPKVKELRSKIANGSVDLGALESEVYDHLYSFFRRYYSDGDFLARRVYKPGVYAIPYEGEEVTLYWANRDQYYIKTTEYLRDYAFRLRPNDPHPMRVHFRLVDAAEGEHGNVKAADGKERIFILAAAGESGHKFLSLSEGEQGPELEIAFEYRPATLADWPESVRKGKTKPPAQKDLVSAAIEQILGVSLPELHAWIAELGRAHINASGDIADYSRLQAHLRRYVARNTCDYFIHKDLGGFLRRELDFYVKNEVMHLDDIQDESAPRVEQYLSKIKVIRRIAEKVITFLAQLEDFQKKLWLKKKFVVETTYCITLDRIPKEFYGEIAANEAQIAEWVKLFGIDSIRGDLTKTAYSVPLTTKFLHEHASLMINTSCFPSDFTLRLLNALPSLDNQIDGVLIHSENFQALSFLGTRYKGTLGCVYIDPPYNTDASPIIYKNGYRQSSWASLMSDRMALDISLRKTASLRCVAIDDFEYPTLQGILAELSAETHHATVSVRSKPQGRPTTSGFSPNHEYAVFWGTSDAKVGRLPRIGSKAERYPLKDDTGIYAWANLRKSGSDSDHEDRKRSYYPFFVMGNSMRIPEMRWDDAEESWTLLEAANADEVEVWPIDSDGAEKVWTCSAERAREETQDIRVERDSKGRVELYKKYRPNQDGALPGTWWDNASYSASESGTKVLKELFGSTDFDYPKSIHLVTDCLRACNARPHDLVLDYFGGSGTTAHAVVSLNREDGGSRKFILVEAGDHFETVLVPRVKKITYSPEWNAGRPQRVCTESEADLGPHIIKCLRLESYEDTLNNLAVSLTESQQRLLSDSDTQGADRLREQYTLRYMLDVETKDSPSLLSAKAFEDPTQYKLRVKRSGSDESNETNVDLLETFNWLIGLSVQHIAAPTTIAAELNRDEEKRLRVKGRIRQDDSGPWWFRSVTGTTPDGRKTLIIWRKLTGDPEADNLVLDEWFTKQGYSTKDYEFQLIYVNGDNNLENLKAPDDTWKVRLIDEDFHRLMFDTEGL